MVLQVSARIGAIIDRDRDALLAAIAESVRIPSVRQEANPGMPFGEPVHRALQHALDVGRRLGFSVGHLNGYAGWIDYGSGNDLIGVLSHVDVVPAGKEADWNHPPFGAEIVGGVMYGRGTADDKGPLFSSLFGLKAVRDAGLLLSKRIRLLVGTDEESGWDGLQRYLKTEEVPTCGFSPDGMFTVVNREKGISVLRVVSTDAERAGQGARLRSVRGGTAPNNVPDEAVAHLAGTASMIARVGQVINEVKARHPDASFDLRAETDGDLVRIASAGRSAHAMSPEKGINAIAGLLCVLSRLDLAEDGATRLVRLLDERIGFDWTGASLDMAWCDAPSGPLTLNLGQITIDEHSAGAVLDIRSPVSLPCRAVHDRVVEGLSEPSGSIRVEIQKQSEPLYIPDDAPLIAALTGVYREVTGLEPVLHAIGGGTYARAISNCVCFGAVYPDEEITVHRPNERASVERMILNAKVYGRALYELAK